MHPRISRVRRGGKTYEYVQIVQSYRRKADGIPMHRVVANLGRMSSLDYENLKASFDAARRGKRVAVVEVPTSDSARPMRRIFANLRYLDVAVVLALWEHWGLPELFSDLLPVGDALVAPADVVAALTIQRCVAPRSKLYAQTWFPTTALPELLDVAPAQFNNTRLHRVLEDLDRAGPTLMRRLSRRCGERHGSFAALFLDVTDTWFDGAGPGLAEKAKTKEGLYRPKVGIVLLCNELGFPLRWEVIPGRRHDSGAMHDMLARIQGLRWASKVPVVCDRAMGKTAHLRKIQATDLHFLTALTVSEFGSYTAEIPHRALSEIELGLTDQTCKADVLRAAEAASQAGLEQVAKNLYVLDLGKIELPMDDTADSAQDPQEHEDKTARAMRLGRQARQALDEGKASSYRAAGSPLGLTKEQVHKYLKLVTLPEDIQQAVLDGKAAGLAINDLLRLAAVDGEQQQRAEFDRLLVEVPPRRDNRRMRPVVRTGDTLESKAPAEPTPVRAVVCFNPEMFVEQRRTSQRRLRDIKLFVEELNASLASPRSRRKESSVAGVVDAKLRRYDLVNAFDLTIDKQKIDGRQRYRVRLELKPDEWARRERYCGFSLLIAHRELHHSASELALLYRAKDAVERDFGVIKGLVKMRPVRHRTDPKVRAHVTLCMLALLLERTMHHKLAESQHTTLAATAAMDLLATCHLNQEADGDTPLPIYTLTRPTADQASVLRALQLEHLADDAEIADRIVPR